MTKIRDNLLQENLKWGFKISKLCTDYQSKCAFVNILYHLQQQQIVIELNKFIELGFRK